MDNTLSTEETILDSFSSVTFENTEGYKLSCRYSVGESGLFISIASVIVYSVTGIPSNIIVLYIYLKEKQSYANDCYIIILAVIDLFSLIVLLPQFIILPYIACSGFYDILTWSYNAITFMILGPYIFSVDGMTLERFVAVSNPFAFKTYKMYVQYVVILTSFAWVLASIVLIQIIDSEHLFIIFAIQAFIWGVFLVGFMLPFIFYPFFIHFFV